MPSKSTIIKKAEFNPTITTYILLVVSFFLLISLAGIPLLVIWFLGVGQYVSKRYYESLECNLTNHHLEFKKGIFFRIEKTIPLENIQDLTFIENPLLKYFGLRILKIETAGQSNPQGSDMKLIGIVDAAKFKDEVLEQRELLNGQTTVETVTVQDPNNKLLTEIRDLLIDIKNK